MGNDYMNPPVGYKLRNSFPPCFIRVIKMTNLHVIFLYPDNRSSLIDRDTFNRFYEEVTS